MTSYSNYLHGNLLDADYQIGLQYNNPVELVAFKRPVEIAFSNRESAREH